MLPMVNAKMKGVYLYLRTVFGNCSVKWKDAYKMYWTQRRLFQGTFRNGGIIMFGTSIIQAVNIDQNRSLLATGKRGRLGQFRVHKIKEGGIRMFESVLFPKQFIRLHDGKVDCMVGL